MKKIKATDWYELSKSKEFYQIIDFLLKKSKEETKFAEVAKEKLKYHYDKFREINETDVLCSFVTVEGKESVYVIIFENKKADGKFYKLEYDKEEDVHYIMA